ncbi:MAG TPA: ABC transporter substrate-binding protein [Casimicrobiaceae bacterium]|nr:ABC transporter substrate-binding protein [Casimicrobiaceae bacterium]
MALPLEPSAHFRRRRQILGGTAAALLALGAAPLVRGAAKPLQVGGLPVTCNLTLPVACAASSADRGAAQTSGALFEFTKINGWPELKESLMAGRLQAAYMLAPMIMDLASSAIPVKVVSLGHRSGAVIMVRTDSPYKHFKDLTAKRVAIPSRFAVDYLFLRKMLAKEGMTLKDVEVVEMAPSDMPAALYAKAVDAYATGEPFGAVAQKAGYARPLSMTRDEWPNYICCVLTVRDELIKENSALVQQLVNYVYAAGAWLDAAPANRTRAVQLAAGPKFFNQDPAVLQFVMDNPSDRVTYGDLRLIRSEFEELMELSMAAGTIKRHAAYENYVDESFVKNASKVSIAL